MKDLEKIKSEDLAAQVQDANPANFAIEQEVAALVGATLPAPTEPSADDARELGAQLLVFLRRALTPIQTALRTAVAAIYAHLDSRCTDYTPAAYASFTPTHHVYDPMGSTPRTLPNLLTALTAFSARKISNLGNGIPDGATFARLVFDDTYAAANIRGIGDDSAEPWVLRKSVLYTGLTYANFNISSINIPSGDGAKGFVHNCPNFTDATLDNLLSVYFANSRNGATYFLNACAAMERVSIPLLQYIRVNSSEDASTNILSNCTSLEDVSMPSLEEVRIVGGFFTSTLNFLSGCSSLRHVTLRKFKFFGFGGAYTQRCYANMMKDCPLLESVELGTEAGEITSGLGISTEQQQSFSGCPNLIDITIGGVGMVNCNFSLLSAWNPTNVLADADKTATFLQNFREHIALRLTSNGSGKTLTLSQAVFDTIWNGDGTPKSTDPDSVIYQINKIIKTDKHWSVNRA